jgi:hypothetical protein
MFGEASTSLVTVRKAATMTGLSEKAIRRKIETGKWQQGRHFHKSPDAGIFIDLEAVSEWIRHGKGRIK